MQRSGIEEWCPLAVRPDDYAQEVTPEVASMERSGIEESCVGESWPASIWKERRDPWFAMSTSGVTPRFPSIALRCIEATDRWRTVQGSSLDGAQRNRGIVRWRVMAGVDLEGAWQTLVRHVDLRRDATVSLDCAALHRGYGSTDRRHIVG